MHGRQDAGARGRREPIGAALQTLPVCGSLELSAWETATHVSREERPPASEPGVVNGGQVAAVGSGFVPGLMPPVGGR